MAVRVMDRGGRVSALSTLSRKKQITYEQTLVALQNTVMNAISMRTQAFQSQIDGKRKLNKECGYPDVISPESYVELWKRFGLAERVIKCKSEATWESSPDIYETEKQAKTKKGVKQDKSEWEKRLDELEKKHQIRAKLARLDELAGVGQYGVMLIGLNDGLKLSQPVAGINPKTGEPTPNAPKEREITSLRPFMEIDAKVVEWETDRLNPRYGKPKFYRLNLNEVSSTGKGSSSTSSGPNTLDNRVHWTRVVHFADECTSSEIFATPRAQACFNTLLDARKIAAAAPEMFWKGGFPGLGMKVDPAMFEAGMPIKINKKAIRKEIEDYQNGLQRYLALVGMEPVSLGVQVADPTQTMNMLLQLVATTIAVPLSVLLGTDQAKLGGANSTDQFSKQWSKRLSRRQNLKITPNLIRPFIDRLMHIGVLPRIEEYFVDWPNLDEETKAEKIKNAVMIADALSKYIAGDCRYVMPEKYFLTLVLGFSEEEADAMLEDGLELEEEDQAEADANVEAGLAPDGSPLPLPPVMKGPGAGGPLAKKKQVPPGTPKPTKKKKAPTKPPAE